jgi:hypothetical protein
MIVKRPWQTFPLVEVVWDDAAAMTHGWKTKEEFDKESVIPELMLSVGFLIKETPDHIIIAMDVDRDGGSNQRSQIPRSMVKKIKILRKADEVKEKIDGSKVA